MLEEHEVPARKRRHAVNESVVGIGELVLVRVFDLRRAVLFEDRLAFLIELGFSVEPPVFLGEREIRRHPVELADRGGVIAQKLGVLERVALLDLRHGGEAVQMHVDVGDGPGVPHAFLPEQPDVHRTRDLLSDFRAVDEKARRSGGRVIQAMTRLGLDHADDDFADFRRGVKLPGGGATLVFVRELLDQVFVGVAKNIGRDIGIIERHVVEYVHGRDQDFRLDPFVARAIRGRFVPADGVDDSLERRIRLGDRLDAGVELVILLARFRGPDVIPETIRRNDEVVALGPEAAQLFLRRRLAVILNEGIPPTLGFPRVVVREPFEKQQREDVGLVILYFAAQASVGHAPEKIAELLFGEHMGGETPLGATGGESLTVQPGCQWIS